MKQPQVLEEKRVILSQVLEDLNAGMTKWKKDDIGYGSLEKKYNLLPGEMVSLLAHPKLANADTRIPNFVIVDDLPEIEQATPVQNSEPIVLKEQPVQQPVAQTSVTRIEVADPVTHEEEIVAFI